MMGDYSTNSKPRIFSKFAEQRTSKTFHFSPKDGLAERLDGDAPGDDQTDQSESEEFGTCKKKKKRKKLGRIGSPSLTHTDRLASFAVCSSDDKIIASSYAGAGFSYAADSDSIYCSVCGLTLFGFIRCRIGTYGDPLSLHRAHRPDCAFLTTKKWHQDTTEGQATGPLSDVSLMTIQQTDSTDPSIDPIPSADAPLQKKYDTLKQSRLLCVISKVREEEKTSSKINMHIEISRRLTFLHKQTAHPNNQLSVCTLAQKGFYLVGEDEDGIIQIKCAFCEANIPVTERVNFMSEVERLHYSLKPDCPFMRGKKTQNIPDIFNEALWSHSKSEQDNSAASLSALGVRTNLAKHPLLAVLDNRKSTFLTYPHLYMSRVDVDLLADAGHFYQGDGDSVTCFYCDCKSGNWSSSEDVWKRHARTSPHCQHVLSTKGANFVSATLEELGEYHQQKLDHEIQNVTTRMIRPRWDSPVVRRAMELGVDEAHLKTAIINRIKRGEKDFRYLSEVIQEVYDLKVPPAILQQRDTALHDRLPEVIQLTNSDEGSVDQEDVLDHDDNGAHAEECKKNTRQVDTTNQISNPASQAELEKEQEPTNEFNVKDMITQLTCKICFSAAVGIIFLPCGHLVCCVSCAPAMVDCPICRKTVNGTVQAFL